MTIYNASKFVLFGVPHLRLDKSIRLRHLQHHILTSRQRIIRASGNGGIHDIHAPTCSGVRPLIRVSRNREGWEADEGPIWGDGVRLSRCYEGINQRWWVEEKRVYGVPLHRIRCMALLEGDNSAACRIRAKCSSPA